MKNTPTNVKILIGVNILIILSSFFLIKGMVGLFMVPILFILNIIIAVIASSDKDAKLKTAAIILIFVGPIYWFFSMFKCFRGVIPI